MKTVLAIFDGFFKNHDSVFADVVERGRFEDFVSPWDDVKYPGINKALPLWVVDAFVSRLSDVVGEAVHIQAIFARLTSSDMGVAPHRIHCDKLMGQYSAHVYLSKEWPAFAGTAFWDHATEGAMQTDQTDVERVMSDSHLESAWRNSFTCQGRYNRLLIHDSRLWHSAEPAGGWGTTPTNGRVVLTCFFNTIPGDFS